MFLHWSSYILHDYAIMFKLKIVWSVFSTGHIGVRGVLCFVFTHAMLGPVCNFTK